MYVMLQLFCLPDPQVITRHRYLSTVESLYDELWYKAFRIRETISLGVHHNGVQLYRHRSKYNAINVLSENWCSKCYLSR